MMHDLNGSAPSKSASSPFSSRRCQSWRRKHLRAAGSSPAVTLPVVGVFAKRPISFQPAWKSSAVGINITECFDGTGVSELLRYPSLLSLTLTGEACHDAPQPPSLAERAANVHLSDGMLGNGGSECGCVRGGGGRGAILRRDFYVQTSPTLPERS